MATIYFTSHLQKFAPCGPVTVAADTVGAALHDALANSQQLRSYIFDEQDRLRRHVTIFVDGQLLTDRVRLTDRIAPASELYVMQALSGG